MSDSLLTQEIRQCMSDLIGTFEGRITARFLFPPGFIGFKGHFPGRPILAGVCQVQAVVVMLEEWKKRQVKIDEIIFAKFLLPVSSGEELIFECRERSETGEKALVSALATRKGSKVAEIRIGVSFGDERQVNNGGKA